ncbi:PfkB family carbohydrate kinase [Streptomyces sp. NPDC057740]|uniref:PfkB family carbohydrate kinase n=1 Tax=Streptomyces sp. NPDC057740 TaxID=3346234 RepID=UPI003683F683
MSPTGPCNAPDGVDVVALGESMVTFLPTRPGRLADVPSFERGIGGAESNVACALAAAGHRVRWVSRVGADGFGDHLVEAIGRYGVDVASVRRDPGRPTGVYFRTAADRGTDAHEVAYYRAGSAASAMSVRNVDLDAVRSGRVLHLSGITAALSEGCLGLLRELLAAGGDDRPLVSFDVNYRAGLWRDGDEDGPGVLLELARRADVVFVGEDEAEEAWGITGGPEAVRAALPEPEVLVVKQGAVGATAFVSGAGGGGLAAPTRRSHTCHSLAPLGWANAPAPQGAAGGPEGSQPTGGSPVRLGSVDGPSSRGADTGPGGPRSGGSRPVRPGWADGSTSRGAAGGPGGSQPAGSRAAGTAPDPRRGGAAPARVSDPHLRPALTPGTPRATAFVPSPNVHIAAATGAGDAFAAGFLSAALRGLAVREALRHGHLWAAAALTAPGDLATPPSRAHADRLVALDDVAWEKLRLGPGWTQAAERADEEVRTS